MQRQRLSQRLQCAHARRQTRCGVRSACGDMTALQDLWWRPATGDTMRRCARAPSKRPSGAVRAATQKKNRAADAQRAESLQYCVAHSDTAAAREETAKSDDGSDASDGESSEPSDGSRRKGSLASTGRTHSGSALLFKRGWLMKACGGRSVC